MAGSPGATHARWSVTHICERADRVVFLPCEAQWLMPENIVEAKNYGCWVQIPRTLLAVQWLEFCTFTAKGPGSIPVWRTKIPKAVQFSSVHLLSRVQFFATPWTAARQASLSITNSWSLLKLMSIESVMPSNHLMLCCPLLLLPSIFPSIRVFSNESVLHIRWPKYCSFSINPSNEYSGLISFRMDWLDLLAV